MCIGDRNESVISGIWCALHAVTQPTRRVNLIRRNRMPIWMRNDDGIIRSVSVIKEMQTRKLQRMQSRN